MAKLNEDLQVLQTARDEMKLALIVKGQEPTDDIRTYAEEISTIKSGIDVLYNTLYSMVSPNKQIFNRLTNILGIKQDFIADGGTEEEIKESLKNILNLEEVVNE